MAHAKSVLFLAICLAFLQYGFACETTTTKAPRCTTKPPPKCIPPPRPKCGPNEKFIESKVPCPGDSCILNYVAIDCIANQTSKPGCVCINGYRRNATGGCIPKDKCLRLECVNDPNAVSGCGNRCGKTCRDYKTKPKDCPTTKCIKNGCDCKKGYIYDENVELCVKPDNCTTQCTGDNEEYASCIYADCSSPRTCDQVGYQFKNLCPRYPRGGCPSGCICKAGYVRDSCGNCINIKDCPNCGGDVNAVSGCGNHCGNSCTDFYKSSSISCPAICYPNGCDCRDGYVYDKNEEKCVKTDECSDYGCPANSSYVSCNVKCPSDYCPKDDKPQPVCAAPYPCTGGCRCNQGYKLNDNDECILATDCPKPKPKCGPSEKFIENKVSCPGDSCMLNYVAVKCMANQTSSPGCVCIDGYRRNASGGCVPKEKCLRVECVNDPNAVSGCGNRCGKTCRDYKNKPEVCPLACIQNGCDCKKGYIYDENIDLCVKPENCTEQCAGDNEEHSSCIYGDCTTPRTCEQLGYPSKIKCPKYPEGCCPSGCICKAGFVRDSCGNCIDINDCPSCGGDVNAVSGCSNYCGNRCTDFYKNGSIACPEFCEVNGCDCREGFVYDDDKEKCVKTDECTDYGCPANSSYASCNFKCPNDYCPKDDQPQPVCDAPYLCQGGCRCKLNYRLNDNDECILSTDCPPINCTRPNEVYNSCPSVCLAEQCEDRNKKPQTCPTLVLNCQPACVCKKNYWRNKNGICVSAKKCGQCEARENQSY